MTEQRDALLVRSDFSMARDEIINRRRMFKDQAAKDGSTVSLIIPADDGQGFQGIVDSDSSGTWTGLWPDRGQFAE